MAVGSAVGSDGSWLRPISAYATHTAQAAYDSKLRPTLRNQMQETAFSVQVVPGAGSAVSCL
eukprot:1510282-Rhodomonas_salina.2